MFRIFDFMIVPCSVIVNIEIMEFGKIVALHKNGVNLLSTLYNRIESVCKELGITVTEMCRRANVPRGNLSDLKMGRQKGLSAKNLQQIANALGVSSGYLLGQDTKKAPTPKGERVVDEEMWEFVDAMQAADEATQTVVRRILGLP